MSFEHFKIKKPCLIMLVSLLSLPIFAAFVQPDRALGVAQNWMNYRNNQNLLPEQILAYNNGNLQLASQQYDLRGEALPQLYLIHYTGGAYTIVAADDQAFPVLAYDFASVTNPTDMPPAVSWWLQNYSSQIDIIRAENLTDADNYLLWDEIGSGNLVRFANERNVSPLVEARWNQNFPYNELCPADPAGPGGRVYAGCVATAMGMVLKYWNSPITGQGSNTYYASGYGYQSANFGNTTYLWDQMPNSISASNIPIATLLYHLAVSVNMNFAPDGSGSNGNYAANAMRNNFRYPNAVLSQKSNYSASGWETLMRAQIDNGTPMYYSGSDAQSGHAFVLDGYQGTNHFHFNFGWSGSYDGYYYVNALNPGSYTFNYGQAAITNAIPANYTMASPRIQIKAGAALVGDPMSINLRTYPVLTSWNVNSYSFNFFYDHTNIDFLGYSIDNTISAGGNLVVSENEPGLISVSWNRSTPLFGGGSLINFNFRANEPGEYYFDAVDMYYNSTALTNVEALFTNVAAPVASLSESAISMTNAMQVGYHQIATMNLRSTHILPSWNVTNYRFNITFDPAKVEFFGLETTETLSAGMTMSSEVTSPGLLYVEGFGTEALSGSGNLVKVLFRAIGNGSSSSATHIIPHTFFYNQTQIMSISNGYIVLAPYASSNEDITSATVSLNAYPNPFNPSTRISFQTTTDAPTTIQVFNIKGQLVKTMLNSTLPIGSHSLEWNGESNSNQSLGSGLYFVRLSHKSQTKTIKLLMMK